MPRHTGQLHRVHFANSPLFQHMSESSLAYCIEQVDRSTLESKLSGFLSTDSPFGAVALYDEMRLQQQLVKLHLNHLISSTNLAHWQKWALRLVILHNLLLFVFWSEARDGEFVLSTNGIIPAHVLSSEGIQTIVLIVATAVKVISVWMIVLIYCTRGPLVFGQYGNVISVLHDSDVMVQQVYSALALWGTPLTFSFLLLDYLREPSVKNILWAVVKPRHQLLKTGVLAAFTVYVLTHIVLSSDLKDEFTGGEAPLGRPCETDSIRTRSHLPVHLSPNTPHVIPPPCTRRVQTHLDVLVPHLCPRVPHGRRDRRHPGQGLGLHT